jgi:hypothetical protein
MSANDHTLKKTEVRDKTEPGIGGYPIVTSDSTVLDPTPRSLYVGGAGDLTVTGVDGIDVTFPSVPAGTVMPIRCTKVKATGTTATNIRAIY